MIETPVIINPERFVEAQHSDELTYRQAKMRARQQNKVRQGILRRLPVICEACLFGRHASCQDGHCPCIHWRTA